MMAIQKRDYYPLPLAASILDCTTDHLIHLAANGKTRLGVLFEIDGFCLERYSLLAATGYPTGEKATDFLGFVYIDRGYIKSFEMTGNLSFNAVEMLDGRVVVTFQPEEKRATTDVYMHSVDLEALKQKPVSAVSEHGDHVSANLALMNRAAVEFWSTADRDDRTTHPENSEVSTWLLKQGLSSPSAADDAASLIRPKWAAVGRKPGK